MVLPKSRDLSHIPVYVPGKSEARVKAEYGLDRVVKLASNENPLGASPKALQAMHDMLTSTYRYPDHSSDALRSALSAFYRIPREHFIIAAGLEEMINCISRAYLLHGEAALMPKMSFIKYVISVNLMGSKPVYIPMKHYGIDLEAFADRIDDSTKIIWLANPNNPTGTYLNETELRDFLDKVPRRILVVLDEAYIDFADARDYPRLTEHWFKEYPNLLVLRTFSKAYGLASARIGYAVGLPELVEPILRVREIFSVSSIAEAGACAALEDAAFVQTYQQLVWKEKRRIYRELDRLASKGVSYVPTQANFLYIETPKESRQIFAEFQAKGIIIRPAGEKGLRVTIGREEENTAFLKALEELTADQNHRREHEKAADRQ